MVNNEFYFSDETTSSAGELEKMARQLIGHLTDRLGLRKSFALSMTIVSDSAIQAINRQYRGKDAPTDVISFAFDDADDRGDSPIDDLGEIVISYDTALRQAAFYKHPAERELAFLMIHGFLHLLGYDHMKSDEEAKRMFALQNDLLDTFSYDYREV